MIHLADGAYDNVTNWSNSFCRFFTVATYFLRHALQLKQVSIANRDEYLDGLAQDCSISSALAVGVLQSCTKPSISCLGGHIISFLFFQFCVSPNFHYYRCHIARSICPHGPLSRYAKLLVAHAPGMAETFFPRSRVSDLDMHHGPCVTHVPWCMAGSLTSGFLRSQWWGKRSRHSRRMRNPQFCVSGKRSIPS